MAKYYRAQFTEIILMKHENNIWYYYSHAFGEWMKCDPPRSYFTFRSSKQIGSIDTFDFMTNPPESING